MREQPDPNSQPAGQVFLDAEELALAFLAADLAFKFWSEKIAWNESVKFDGWRHKDGLAEAEIAAAQSLKLKLSVHRHFQFPEMDGFGVPIEQAAKLEISPPEILNAEERNVVELDRFFARVSGTVKDRAAVEKRLAGRQVGSKG